MDKVSYALGVSVGHNLKSSGVNNIDTADFTKALETMMTGKEPELSFDEINEVLKDFFGKIEAAKKEQQSKSSEANKQTGEIFLSENKKRKEVITLPSGLQYEVLKEGDGAIPTATDSVKCHYHGTLLNGTVFDSSVERDEPAVFGVNQVIKGWVEALQLMSTGSKWKLYIPSELAYGSNGAGGAIGADATLIFEVELLEIV